MGEVITTQARHLMELMTPKTMGLDLDMAMSRAGVPYHISCGAPPEPSQKYIVHELKIQEVEGRMWCSLEVETLPDLVGFIFKLGSFLAPRLEIDGAKVSLPEQSFFRADQRPTFEGNINALGSIVWNRLRPFLHN